MALVIKQTNRKGRGVFTDTVITEGSLIEACPVIIIENDTDRLLVKDSVLGDYLFLWQQQPPQHALALGFGSLYNHSRNSNAEYEMNHETRRVNIYCVRDIKAGEEITINYNGKTGAGETKWFVDRGLKVIE